MTSFLRIFSLASLFLYLPTLTAQPVLPGDRLFGEWKLTECEYWRDGKPITNRQCVVKGDFHTLFLPDRIITQTIGQERPHASFKVSYTDAAETIDGRDNSGVVRRYSIVSPTSVWYIAHNNALDLDVRSTLTKIANLPPQLLTSAPLASGASPSSAPASPQPQVASTPQATNAPRPTPNAKVEKPEFPEEFLGDWGPEKWNCYSDVILSIEPKRIGIGSAGDWDYFGDLNTCFSCEGGARYEGNVIWLTPNFNRKGPPPLIVYLNAGEKKGAIKVELINPALKKSYASKFNGKLKRCR